MLFTVSTRLPEVEISISFLKKCEDVPKRTAALKSLLRSPRREMVFPVIIAPSLADVSCTLLPEAEVVPEGQLEQEAEPEELLYLPAVQLVHGPPSGPLEPALHLHALLLVLPEGEVESEGQLEQEAEPEALLYLPAVQLVHGPPSGPLEPASQAGEDEDPSCNPPPHTQHMTDAS